MTEYILSKAKCDCTGSVLVLGVRGATPEGVPFHVVSHGVCKRCGMNHELPYQDYQTFISQNCEVNYVI